MSDATRESPAEYRVRRRIAKLNSLQARYSKAGSVISVLRAIVGIVFLALVFSRIGKVESWLVNGVCMLLIAVFSYLVYRHSKLKRKTVDLNILVEHAQTDLNRINLQWNDIPRKTESYDRNSDIANDLKLVGERSLIHLIDTTSSIDARDHLLELFCYPDLNIVEIEHRQKLIQSLIPKHLLFARLRLAGGKAGAEALSGDAIERLLEGSQYPGWGRPLLWLSSVLALANIFLLIVFGLKYFLLPFILYVLLNVLFAHYSGLAFARVLEVSIHLDRIQAVFNILETRVDPVDSVLSQHLAPLHNSSSPSATIGALSKTVSALSVRGFAPAHLIINALLPWDQYHTYKLEQTREDLLNHFKGWIDVTAKTEAYCALANFSRLNPSYCFPEFTGQGDAQAAGHSVKGLGHPLIPYQERVVNDFELHSKLRIAVVTGSNMAGKSAFLRTVGINLCLAQAGSVVCADYYKSSCFRVVSCIDVTDDLDAGKSLFYMEIEKLKLILNTFDQSAHHVLFLIDEILNGTNNRERIIGGKRYLQSLSDKGGYGLVSTHDLEFANLADEVSSMFNVHFQETVLDEKMIFDHKLKPGRSKSTNALRIMEIENII